MAPKSFTGAWKRPATRIYNDNYRFGNSLYSGAVADLDKRSTDRPNLLRTYSPPPLSVDPGVRRAVLEADLGIAGYSNSELHRSLSANRLNELGLTANYKHIAHETTTTTSSNANRAVDTFSTYASAKALANVEAELEESRARRRRQRANLIRPESAYYADELPTMQDPEVTQTSPFWMERWYNKSVRSVRHGVFPL